MKDIILYLACVAHSPHIVLQENIELCKQQINEQITSGKLNIEDRLQLWHLLSRINYLTQEEDKEY